MELYEGFAPFYARKWSGPRAQRVLPGLRNILTSRFPETRRRLHILDIAAGSGDVAAGLSDLGEVVGLEQSIQLRKIARKRFSLEFTSWKLGEDFPCQADRFDAALCLYDSLNYASDWEQVSRFASEIVRVLKNGGIFLTDVNTREGLRERWQGQISIVESWGVATIRYGSEGDGATGTMEFTGFLPNHNSTWKRFDERHVQMAISGNDLLELLRSRGMSDASVVSPRDFSLPDDIGREWVLGTR